MRSKLLRRGILVSALIVFLGLLSFHSSWLSLERTTSAQDPNATLPTKKTTPPPLARKTTPSKTNTGPSLSPEEVGFVLRAQTALEKAGYEVGKRNCQLNARTVAAIRRFQRDRYLPVTGQLDDATIGALGIQRHQPSDELNGQFCGAEKYRFVPLPPATPSVGTVERNSLGMELVWIPPGSFMMGSNNGNADEKPVHRVKISKGFYIGKSEVTQAQWQAVMGNNPSHFKDCGGNCPVEKVSWEEAQRFIEKLNQRKEGYLYRLPSEAEWEYACRAGTTGDYAGNVKEMSWYSENSGSKTHAVGAKQLNAWGLADIYGNVWEWCEDWYHETYHGAPMDGSAWLSGGEQKYRVLRGGSFSSEVSYLRSASRVDSVNLSTFMLVGVRVVAVARTQ